MDSLARVLDIPNTRVTAVGFNRGNDGMLVAANLHPGGTAAYTEALHRRIAALRGFVTADHDDRRAAAQQISRDLPLTTRDRRFVRDLLKLRRSLRGEYRPDSGRNFSEAQREAILRGEWSLRGRGDDVHAELDVARRSETGPLGVSKLSCRDCHDYIVTHHDTVQLRGTHGYRFRGWKDPITRRNAGHPVPPGVVRPAWQIPADSGSDVD